MSPLDGVERLTSVSQLSTDVNICVCTTRDSSLLPRCRVQTTTLPPPGWMNEVLIEIILNMVNISLDNMAAQSWPWRALGPWPERPCSWLGIHHSAPDFPHDVGWTSTKSPTPRTRSLHLWLVSISLGPPPGMPLAVLALSSAVRWHLASLARAPWHQGWSPVLADVARQHRLQILVPSATQCAAEGRWASSSGVRGTSVESSRLQGSLPGQERPHHLQGPGTRLS